MDTLLLLKFFSVFVFVISLMLLFGWGLKKSGLGGPMLKKAGARRLQIVEHLPIDHKRRLVLVRRDDREHLLVLGAESETVIEAGIPAAADEAEVVSFSKEQRNVKV
jgi:flagellar protein FliO/FliZ